MVELGLSEDEGVLLRAALEPLVIVERNGTVSYSPDGLSFITSERDGFVIAALRIKSSDIDYFRISTSGSAGIDLANLYETLQLAGDECSVLVLGDDEDAKISFLFENAGTEEITTSEMELTEVKAEDVDIDRRLQFEYEAVVGIPSADFTNILTELVRSGDKAYVRIKDNKVMFYGLTDAIILSKEHGECIIGGVGEEDEILITISLIDIVSYQDASALSSTVWILYSDHAIPMLNCPVDPIGNIMFYFLCRNN